MTPHLETIQKSRLQLYYSNNQKLKVNSVLDIHYWFPPKSIIQISEVLETEEQRIHCPGNLKMKRLNGIPEISTLSIWQNLKQYTHQISLSELEAALPERGGHWPAFPWAVYSHIQHAWHIVLKCEGKASALN